MPNSLPMRKALFLLFLLLAVSAYAQVDLSRMTRQRAEMLVPRPGMKPLHSSDAGEKTVMDTIATANEHIKILLFTDNTWHYWKDPAYIVSQEMFTECWNNDEPDPYHTSLDNLPSEVTFWVVDTLSSWRCPRQTKVYSPFGPRRRRRHQGVDLPLHTGDPVYAAFDGKVRLSKYHRGYGNLVIIRHENGLETFYGHLSRREVEPGDWVRAGQVIGLGGSTGRSTGPHLHFETRYQGYAFDPQWLIDFESGDLRKRVFTLKKKFLSIDSKYVPESEDVEEEILLDEAAPDQEEAPVQEENPQYHKIRPGDTLTGLARRNGVTIQQLCEWNGLTTKSTLRVGRTIRVK